jgi:hypothetical protein
VNPTSQILRDLLWRTPLRNFTNRCNQPNQQRKISRKTRSGRESIFSTAISSGTNSGRRDLDFCQIKTLNIILLRETSVHHSQICFSTPIDLNEMLRHRATTETLSIFGRWTRTQHHSRNDGPVSISLSLNDARAHVRI